MSFVKKYQLFFGSIFLGLILWGVLFAFLPVTITEAIKTDTIAFIVASYLALILGFLCSRFNKSAETTHKFKVKTILKILILIIVSSFILRWIDLFFVRELSFNNEFKVNRWINDLNYHRSNILFSMASIFKSLYFFPVVIVLASKFKRTHLLAILSYIVLLLPLIEAILKGTRKPVFEIFLIVLLFLVIYDRSKLNFKKIIVLILGCLVVLTISLTILLKRENSYSDNSVFYNRMLNSKYNDMLKPKPYVENFFNNESYPEVLKLYTLIFLQTGQYICHGVFEFNHIIDNQDLTKTKGSYTFVAIPKFINKIGLFNRISYGNPSPRTYVYLTTFGGLYIDFRWATLIIMFLFGVLQKYVYQKSIKSFIYAPILIYFLIINVFLLVINYLRGAGIYPILSFLLMLLVFEILGSKLHEKSIST